MLNSRDHLHLRGEYWEIKLQTKIDEGSSPLTWRIRIDNAANVVQVGIISTYVENTGKSLSYGTVVQDHLHLRGEYCFLLKV